ncbi:MAG: TonB-dependent receptor [Bacteroidota bacterium]
MARYLLLTIAFLAAGFAAMAQTTLSGKVTDAESGQPVILGTVALYKNGVLVTGTETDFDGFYSITELDAGTYDVEFSYTGYGSQKIEGVVISGGKSNKLDAKMTAGIDLPTFEVIYERPLVEQDNTTQGKSLTSEEIKNLPTRSVNALASLAAGVSSSDEGGDLNIRGSRSDGTNYYLDGVRVSGRLIPKQDIEELQVVTGGIEARYGDVTGGIISVTSKGPSDRFSGGLEVESSELFDNYGHNLASLNLSGPILKSRVKPSSATDSAVSIKATRTTTRLRFRSIGSRMRCWRNWKQTLSSGRVAPYIRLRSSWTIRA